MLEANAFLNKCVLIASLKRSETLIAPISEGNGFHDQGAATWNDLSIYYLSNAGYIVSVLEP